MPEDEKRKRGQRRRISIDAPTLTTHGPRASVLALDGIEETPGDEEDEANDEDMGRGEEVEVVQEYEEWEEVYDDANEHWTDEDHLSNGLDVLESGPPQYGRYSSSSSGTLVEHPNAYPSISTTSTTSHPHPRLEADLKSILIASRESRLFEPIMREYLQLLAAFNTDPDHTFPPPEISISFYPGGRRWSCDVLGIQSGQQPYPPGSPVSMYRDLILQELSEVAANLGGGGALVWIVLPQTEVDEGVSEWSCSVKGAVECLHFMQM